MIKQANIFTKVFKIIINNLFCFKILANDIDDEETISVSISEIASSSKQQKVSGRPFNPVWDHFNQIEKKEGHYSAGCKYYPEKWQRADIATFKFHIARFDIPSPKTLAGRIFNKQLVQVETKIEKKLQIENKHLYALRNYSDSRHTAEFLAQEIETMIIQIGKEKFLNLICKDIIKESFAKRILSQATLVTQFFRSCHIANSALKKEIQINNIILEHSLDIISNDKVYVILNRGAFYDDLDFITMILRPIKESIIQLESRDSILADCFIYLIKLVAIIFQMPQDQHITFR
ncbi:2294_t:CDS:2, partial [Gigaspora margarita]